MVERSQFLDISYLQIWALKVIQNKCPTKTRNPSFVGSGCDFSIHFSFPKRFANVSYLRRTVDPKSLILKLCDQFSTCMILNCSNLHGQIDVRFEATSSMQDLAQDVPCSMLPQQKVGVSPKIEKKPNLVISGQRKNPGDFNWTWPLDTEKPARCGQLQGPRSSSQQLRLGDRGKAVFRR